MYTAEAKVDKWTLWVDKLEMYACKRWKVLFISKDTDSYVGMK